jgi:hypothetical protein
MGFSLGMATSFIAYAAATMDTRALELENCLVVHWRALQAWTIATL